MKFLIIGDDSKFINLLQKEIRKYYYDVICDTFDCLEVIKSISFLPFWAV